MKQNNSEKILNIVVPMAGSGGPFQQAGYTFPKPLIDVNGKSMIEMVIENLKPSVPHRFIFVCKKEHYEQYSLEEIFGRAVGKNFEVVQLAAPTRGAACTVLNAINYIHDNNDLIIANYDQIVDVFIDDFIEFARLKDSDGALITFKTTHPKWSFVRLDKNKNIVEVAEKKVISDFATVGIYYFKSGKDFVDAAVSMIEKDIRFNNDFYISLVYNEYILNNKKILPWNIKSSQMHSMATPEDLMKYLMYLMLRSGKQV